MSRPSSPSERIVDDYGADVDDDDSKEEWLVGEVCSHSKSWSGGSEVLYESSPSPDASQGLSSAAGSSCSSDDELDDNDEDSNQRGLVLDTFKAREWMGLGGQLVCNDCVFYKPIPGFFAVGAFVDTITVDFLSSRMTAKLGSIVTVFDFECSFKLNMVR